MEALARGTRFWQRYAGAISDGTTITGAWEASANGRSGGTTST